MTTAARSVGEQNGEASAALRSPCAKPSGHEGSGPVTWNLTEVCDPRAAAHALHPHIRSREIVGGDLLVGDDHLSRKRFVTAIAGPVKIGLEDHGLVSCGGGLEDFGGSTCALESGAG